jgi:hypothetical protein
MALRGCDGGADCGQGRAPRRPPRAEAVGEVIDTPGRSGASLALRWISARSCLRVGLVLSAGLAVAVFLAAFVAWDLVVPGIRSTVVGAFSGSRSVLDSVLGPGTGLVLAGLAALVAIAGTVVVSIVVPLFYGLVARRTGGVGLVLAQAD